ncbi:MAG: Smr/MutS family protein [Bdellovibrionales bacterium]
MNNNNLNDPRWKDFVKTVKPMQESPVKKPPRSKAAIADKLKAGEKKTSLPRTARKLNDLASIKTNQNNPDVRAAIPISHAQRKPRSERIFGKTLERKFKSGDVLIDATLDLHGMTQDQAYASLQKFMETRVLHRSRILLIVTGKGPNLRGVLRASLPNWLYESRFAKNILSIRQAAPKHGQNGAFYIILKKTLPLDT